ncbi:unnamed protein product [Moneuplotes crassus]|uniref:Uncharacterized protein n=1 Tax=Euplotes crassus TaxID=5936 RepID=A0AAD1UC98_EUPCR|nr:unnamed protein product [Moneuplotes crassus]
MIIKVSQDLTEEDQDLKEELKQEHLEDYLKEYERINSSKAKTGKENKALFKRAKKLYTQVKKSAEGFKNSYLYKETALRTYDRVPCSIRSMQEYIFPTYPFQLSSGFHMTSLKETRNILKTTSIDLDQAKNIDLPNLKAENKDLKEKYKKYKKLAHKYKGMEKYKEICKKLKALKNKKIAISSDSSDEVIDSEFSSSYYENSLINQRVDLDSLLDQSFPE